MPAATDPWDPDQYARFAEERRRPFHDLAALVQPRPAMRVLDLGCGTGNLTAWLHRTLQAHETVGVDRSPADCRGAGSAYDGSAMTATPTAPGTDFETVIGLEVHTQLRTATKMFCRCRADYANAAPNTYVCPVCLGMPGMLPVINARAVEWTIKTALALHMTIPEQAKFDRKNYPYPDLMKGYQISQYDLPLSLGGYLDIEVNGQTRRIEITRVHLEEDTARLLHRTNAAGEGYSLIDVNRSGVPLMEIVSEPDLRSPEEARAYLMALHQILRYLEVSTANMEEGSFRCDANISLRPRGSERLGAKVEIKNMNSFRAVHKALQFEQARQAEALRRGESIPQETRGWVNDQEVTVSQRSKEHAHDYRYFPEPDLPPLQVERARVEAIQAALPELPAAKQARFETQYGLGRFEATLLTEEPARAAYFEEAVAAFGDEATTARAKAVANWMVGELARLQSESAQRLEAVQIRPAQIAQLVGLIERGTISNTLAKAVFETMYASGRDPQEIVQASGQTQISDTGQLQAIIDQVIAAQPQAVADFRQGKEEALKFLVGQIMKHTKGRANPQEATRLLREQLQTPGSPGSHPGAGKSEP